jgi:hypothetical protein
LIGFVGSIGLAPGDIRKELDEAGLEWEPNPEVWNDLTNAVSIYAENLKEVAVVA